MLANGSYLKYYSSTCQLYQLFIVRECIAHLAKFIVMDNKFLTTLICYFTDIFIYDFVL